MGVEEYSQIVAVDLVEYPVEHAAETVVEDAAEIVVETPAETVAEIPVETVAEEPAGTVAVEVEPHSLCLFLSVWKQPVLQDQGTETALWQTAEPQEEWIEIDCRHTSVDPG